MKAVNATDSTGLPGAQQPPAKKQKLDDSSAQAAGSQAAAEPREAPAARSPAAADDAGSSEEGGLAGLLGGIAVFCMSPGQTFCSESFAEHGADVLPAPIFANIEILLAGGYASDSDEDAVAVGSRETDSRQTENG